MIVAVQDYDHSCEPRRPSPNNKRRSRQQFQVRACVRVCVCVCFMVMIISLRGRGWALLSQISLKILIEKGLLFPGRDVLYCSSCQVNVKFSAHGLFAPPPLLAYIFK